MAIFLKRDTKVYLEKTVGGTSALWEIPVMDGFSFSQGNTTSEVTLNEMANAVGASKRGRRMFNDALAPAEWSFSTYIRPFKSTIAYDPAAGTSTGGAGGSNNIFAIEEILWANFVGKAGWSTETGAILTATVAITGGVVGTYEIDPSEYTTNGSGTDATFRLQITGPTAGTLTIVNGGKGYLATNALTIQSSAVGGSTTAAITVSTVSTASAPYDAQLDNFLRTTSSLSIYSTGANTAELGTFNLYFVMGASNAGSLQYSTSSQPIEIYKLTGCVVNEATVNFEVDGIAMIDWSGSASLLDTSTSTLDARVAIREGVTSTSNFIRNKLTALQIYAGGDRNATQFAALPGTSVTVTAAAAGVNGLTTGNRYRINTVGTTNWTGIGAATGTVGTVFTYNGTATTGTGGIVDTGIYNIVITGGSMTFSNNITFLTPEVLGIVNQPIGHVAGNKVISGNFTAYVDAGSTGDSGDLFDDMTSAAARSVITNSFNLTFKIGGSAGTTRLEINLPTAHLEIPTIQSEDVISIDVAFHALPSTITQSDEFNLIYVGV